MAQDIYQRWLNGLGPRERSFEIGRQFVSGAVDNIGPRVLFDYGRHFPMAIRPKAGSRGGDGGTAGYGVVGFLVNGDRWSGGWSQTASHQREVIGLLERKGGCVEIPFSALAAAGLMSRSGGDAWSTYYDVAESMEWMRVLDRREDRWGHECKVCGEKCYRDGRHFGVQGSYCIEGSEPKMIEARKKVARDYCTKAGRCIEGDALDEFKGYMLAEQTHVLGGCVFEWRKTRGSKRRWFLSSFDENEPGLHYFLCELPEKPLGMKDALEILKPKEVKEAEAQGVAVKRQGDVFFVEREGWSRKGVDKQRFVKNLKLEGLDGPGSDTGSHQVSEAVMDRAQDWGYKMWKGREYTEEAVVELIRGYKERLQENYLQVSTHKLFGPPYFTKGQVELIQKVATLNALPDDEFVTAMYEEGYEKPGLSHGPYTTIQIDKVKVGASPKPVLVKGRVTHDREHRALALYEGYAKDNQGKNERWWMPVKNRALGGWTAVGGAGGVD
jgi:hypothetical protein